MDPITAALNFATAALHAADNIWEAMTPEQRQALIGPIIDLIIKAQPHASQKLAAPPK